MKFLNQELLSSPYNWAAILVMGILGVAFLALVAPEPTT